MLRRALAAALCLSLSASGAPAWAAAVRGAAAQAPAPAFGIGAAGLAVVSPAGLDTPALLGSAPLSLPASLDAIIPAQASPEFGAPSAASAEQRISNMSAETSALPRAAPVAQLNSDMGAGTGAHPRAALFPSRSEAAPGPAASGRSFRPSAQDQAGALAATDRPGGARASADLSGPIFDGAGLSRPTAALEPVLGLSGAPASGRLLSKGDAGETAPAPGAVPAPKAAPLPASYKLFLGGLAASSIGQAVSTILVPLLAHGRGPAFTALSCGIGLGAVIPGSWLGAWWVRRLGSKSAYIWSNLGVGAMFASLVAAAFWAGGVGPIHFLAFSAAGGIQYGMLRGVAEQDITVRILGNDNESLLKKAGALYYLVVSPVYMGTSMAVGMLLSLVGRDAFSVVGAVTMALSALPFILIRYRSGAAGAAAEEESDSEKGDLPLQSYLPYLFFWTMHYGFYYLLSPFFSLEIFHQDALGGWFVGFYALGNLLYSLVNVFAPQVLTRISLQGWTMFGIATAGVFLWTTLGLGIPALSIAAALLLGMGMASGLIQWKAYYQKRLPRLAMVKAFRNINTATIVLNLIPLIFLYGTGFLFPGVSVPFLLLIISAGATAAGAALISLLLHGGIRFDPPSGKS